MRIAEWLLLQFSREANAGDYSRKEWDLESALRILESQFPGFRQEVKGKRIVDYGCGMGFQTVALARNGAEFVLGLDINPRLLEEAGKLAAASGCKDRAKFVSDSRGWMNSDFDMVISQNSMEHFVDPMRVLDECERFLKPSGLLYVIFGPPWYSPYGAHMHFFTRIPWVHLIFSEDCVMEVRSRYRKDGARRYEDVEGGLNRMSIRKLERLVDSKGFSWEYRRYECVKQLNFLGKVPILRELVVNRVICVLSKRPRPLSATTRPLDPQN